MKKLLTALCLIFTAQSLWAQGLELETTSIEYDTIDIQGRVGKRSDDSYQSEARSNRVNSQLQAIATPTATPTEADRLKSTRERLEKRNDEILAMELEKLRLKSEAKLTNDINKHFDQELKE